MSNARLHDRTLALNILGSVREITMASILRDGAPYATTVSFASDGFSLYAAIGIDSQKAHNIRRNPRLSLTANVDHKDWDSILGLTMHANGIIVSDPDEMARASALLLLRFPQCRRYADTSTTPWGGTVFIQIVPYSVTLINYAQGFGHSVPVSIAA